jgi:phage terminase small subunit
MALPLENHRNEVNESLTHPSSIETGIIKLHQKLKETLKPNEWLVYKSFYIDNESEVDIARKLNFKTTEKNRSPGYKQIKNIQKSIISKAKRILERNELDWL